MKNNKTFYLIGGTPVYTTIKNYIFKTLSDDPNFQNTCEEWLKELSIKLKLTEIENTMRAVPDSLNFLCTPKTRNIVKRQMLDYLIYQAPTTFDSLKKILKAINKKDNNLLKTELTKCILNSHPYTSTKLPESLLIQELKEKNIPYIKQSEILQIGQYISNICMVDYQDENHQFTIEPYIDYQEKDAIESTMKEIVKKQTNQTLNDYYLGYDCVAKKTLEANETIYDMINEKFDEAYIFDTPTIQKLLTELATTTASFCQKNTFCKRYKLEDITSTIDFIQENIDNELFNTTYDLSESFKIAKETKINVALVLQTAEDFNIEFGNDSYGYNYEPDSKPLNAIQRFANKAGYSNKQLKNAYQSTSNDKTLNSIINEMQNGYSNSTLIVPLQMTWDQIAEQLINHQKDVTLNDKNTKKLGLMSYIFGSGSVFEMICPKSKNIVYHKDEWTLLIEETYGFDLDSVYGGETFNEFAKNNNPTDIFKNR